MEICGKTVPHISMEESRAREGIEPGFMGLHEEQGHHGTETETSYLKLSTATRSAGIGVL